MIIVWKITLLSQMNQAEEEIKECDRLERENMAAFTGWKRINCFIHTLQLVVKILKLILHWISQVFKKLRV